MSSSAKLVEASRENAVSSAVAVFWILELTVGPSFVFSMSRANVLWADASPSDAVPVIEMAPTSPFLGVPESSPVVASMDSQLGSGSPFSRVAE